MNHKYKFVLILLLITMFVSACGGGDDKEEATNTPLAKATNTAKPAPTETPALTPELKQSGPKALGQEIGTVYVEALIAVIDLIKDQPPADEVRSKIKELEQAYIQKLVALGWQREALNEQERAAVDLEIRLAIDQFYQEDEDRWNAYTQAQTYYAKQDPDFNELIVNFNIIGQYANFDLLKKQEPEQAVRLGIIEPDEIEQPTPPPTAAPIAELGKEQRSAFGGFSFRPILDYQVEESFGLVGMDAPDGDPDVGPAILMTGYADKAETTLEELLAGSSEDADGDIIFSDPQEIVIDGAPALLVDVSGSDETGVEIAGRIVVALPAPTQSFMMIGIAPSERWSGELEPLFGAVLASVGFFEPESGAEEPDPGGALTHQWAVSATASSAYGESDYAASQATGAPDTLTDKCVDQATAWASLEPDTVEWLELGYDVPVLPAEINVVQTHSPDQVIKVDVIDLAGEHHEVYTAEPGKWEECPYTLSIPVDVNFQVMGVKITIDQSLSNWNEIDAVELVGYAERPAIPAEGDQDPIPMPLGELPQVELQPGWTMYSNVNYVQDLALHDGLLWAATGGGLAAWQPKSGEFMGRWSTQDGLIHNEAYAVVACSLPDEVRIVVGTRGGISLYDPATDTWENWNSDNSEMSRDFVVGLECHAESQTLLIGYSGMVVDVYDAASGEWQSYDSYNDGLGGASAGDFAIVGDMQEIWVSGATAVSVITADGITVYDEDNSDIPDDALVAAAVDDAGNVWLGAADGIIRVNADGSFTLYNEDNVVDWPLGMSYIEGLAFAADGSLWASAGFGQVCHFDPDTATCVGSYRKEPGMAGSFNENLIIDEQGYVYYTSDSEGISFFDGDQWQQLLLESEKIVDNELTAIAQGADGSIWIGTETSSAQRFYAYDVAGDWDSFAGEIPNLFIQVFYPQPDGGMWVGHGSGASFYASNGVWSHLDDEQGLIGGSVEAITIDDQGRVWLATGYEVGVNIWDGQSFSYLSEAEGQLPTDSVFDLLADGSAVWLATSEGLLRYENDEFTLFDKDNSDLPNNAVYALALDVDGSLLVDAGSTLLRVQDAGATITEVTRVGDYIESIFVTPAGEIWLGTFDAGAYHFDGSDWTQYTTADGLASPNFFHPHQILVDYLGGVWFASPYGGLTRYVP